MRVLHISQSISNFPLILDSFLSSDMDGICYIDLFWEGICDVGIIFFENSSPPHFSFPPSFDSLETTRFSAM